MANFFLMMIMLKMVEDNDYYGCIEDDCWFSGSLNIDFEGWAECFVALESFKSLLDGRSCIVPYLNWWEHIHYVLKSWSHEPHPWRNGHRHSSARFSSTTLTQPHPLLTGNRSDGGPDPPTSVHRGQTRRLLQWQPVTSRWWHAQVEPSNYNKGMEEHQHWSWCLEACQDVCHWLDYRQDRLSFASFCFAVSVYTTADTVLKWTCNALITVNLDL